jgi:hypothetical protein
MSYRTIIACCAILIGTSVILLNRTPFAKIDILEFLIISLSLESVIVGSLFLLYLPKRKVPTLAARGILRLLYISLALCFFLLSLVPWGQWTTVSQVLFVTAAVLWCGDTLYDHFLAK